MPHSIAIIGAGPSAFYAADALNKKIPGCRIDLIDRLATPYGLLRSGVAPDHQSTKNTMRVFERIFSKGDMRFFGNVTVDGGLSLAQLRAAYDAVILAVGAPLDRPLAIPGADKAGVYGAIRFVGWYNGHPDHAGLAPDLGGRAIGVIGNGNVALDIARLLAKTAAELAGADLADDARAALAASPVTDIYIFGRRGPWHAGFAAAELKEHGALARAIPLVHPEQLAGPIPSLEESGLEARSYRQKQDLLAVLRDFSQNSPDARPVRIHFEFFARPLEVLGEARIEGLRLARTRLDEGRLVDTGETFEVPLDVLISAIGFRSRPLEGAPFDEARGLYPNRDGLIEGNLFVVGWAKRGPSGTIPTNRADSAGVVDKLVASLSGPGRNGRGWLESHLAACAIRPVSFDDWRKIDAAEKARASGDAPRAKFTRLADMLAVLDDA